MFFDTHVHFDHLKGRAVEEVVRRALEAGVTRMIAVGSAPDANRQAIVLAERFPEHIKAAVGYDRDQAGLLAEDASVLESALRELAEEIRASGHRVAAVGEIGLDFHYSPQTAGPQVRLMDEQLVLARKLKLPVIVHSREADEETLQSLARHAKEWRGERDRIGVVHCFTGGVGFARELLELGFYISFSGIVTFPNAASVREAAVMVPDDRLLIETDTPYLAPVPHRGKENEPAFVRHVAEKLGEIRKCSVDRIAGLTMRNGERLFGPWPVRG